MSRIAITFGVKQAKRFFSAHLTLFIQNIGNYLS